MSLVLCSAVCENAHRVQKIPESDMVADMLSLPTLLSQLIEEGLLTRESEIISQSCELYKLARYGDGVSYLIISRVHGCCLQFTVFKITCTFSSYLFIPEFCRKSVS